MDTILIRNLSGAYCSKNDIRTGSVDVAIEGNIIKTVGTELKI